MVDFSSDRQRLENARHDPNVPTTTEPPRVRRAPQRIRMTTAVLFASSAAWGLAAWFARDTRLWAIELTNYLFALGLVVSYVGAWSLSAIWRRGPLRHAVFRAVTATLVLAIMAPMLEAPAILGLIDYSEVWERLTGEWRGPARNFEVDPELGHRRFPNIYMVGYCTGDIAGGWNMPREYSRPLEFTFNAQGFRSRSEYTQADVVTLGDSYIEGWNVSDGETCPERLAELTGLRVANLAQSGYGTLQELGILKRHGPALSPRLVIWFFYEGNDLFNDDDYENAVSYYSDHAVSAPRRLNVIPWNEYCRASFVANLFRGMRRTADPVVPNNMPYFGWVRDEHGDRHRMLFSRECLSELSDWELGRFETTKEAFRAGKAWCEQHGSRLLICYLPTKFRVHGSACEFAESSPCRQWQLWDMSDRVAKFCHDENISYLDLTPPMRDTAAAGQILYALSDTHWDRAGHALVSELLQRKCYEFGIRGGRQTAPPRHN